MQVISIDMTNRKVLNAEGTTVGDYYFRSRLEGSIWENVFKDSGLDIRPESEKIVLQDAFKPAPFYEGMVEHFEKQRQITYTPDFVCYDSDGIIIGIIEVKGGYKSDRYPMKRKMVLKTIKNWEYIPVFFEIHNKREAKFCVDKLKELL